MERVKNIVEEGENADHRHFPTMFLKALLNKVVKSRDCVVKG